MIQPRAALRPVALCTALSFAVAAAPAPVSAQTAQAAACLGLFNGHPEQGLAPPRALVPGLLVTYRGEVDDNPAYDQHWITSTADGVAVEVDATYTTSAATGAVNATDRYLTDSVASGDIWASPEGLAACPADFDSQTPAGEVQVLRTRTALGGAEVPAVQVTETLAAGKVVVVFDLATGLAVSYTALEYSTAENGVGQFTLESVSRLPAPFDKDPPLPAFVRRGATLHYALTQSTQTSSNASLGLAPTVQHGSASVQVTAAGSHEAEIVFNSDLVAFGAPHSLASNQHGALGGAYGVFWMPPSTIRALGTLRVIHRDAPMRELIVAGHGPDDTALFGIRVGAYRLEAAYSARTGVLLEEQENSGSAPAMPALDVPSTQIVVALTLQSAR